MLGCTPLGQQKLAKTCVTAGEVEQLLRVKAMLMHFSHGTTQAEYMLRTVHSASKRLFEFGRFSSPARFTQRMRCQVQLSYVRALNVAGSHAGTRCKKKGSSNCAKAGRAVLRRLVSRTLAQHFADHFDAACRP